MFDVRIEVAPLLRIWHLRAKLESHASPICTYFAISSVIFHFFPPLTDWIIYLFGSLFLNETIREVSANKLTSQVSVGKKQIGANLNIIFQNKSPIRKLEMKCFHPLLVLGCIKINGCLVPVLQLGAIKKTRWSQTVRTKKTCLFHTFDLVSHRADAPSVSIMILQREL